MTLPETLPGRDFRNPDHVATAMRIVQELAGFYLMKSSATAIQEMGIPLPPKTKIYKRSPSARNLALGNAYLLEKGLYLPDNVIRQCHDCRMALQFRPNLGYSTATCVCVFCAATRLLTEHWAKSQYQSKRPG